jgi:tungstate transport system ATP-binding protein
MKSHMPLYQISNLEHRYQQTPVLQIDELSIDKHTITGLVGPNGSGKTTLLKLLAFIEKPTRGEIRFNGRPELPFSDNTRLSVSLLTQEPYLMRRTVYDNVYYGLKIRKEKTDARKKIPRALSWVGLPPERFSKRFFSELSGGEAQRVALAARLVLEPRVLLLDEPTANVDAHSAVLIREAALRARKKWGTTLIVASHDRQWLYNVCDTVIHLNRGQLFAAGMENFIEGPWHPLENGSWGKTLGDRQCIIVPKPPTPNAVAQITPEISSSEVEKNSPEIHGLSGTVTGLMLNRQTREIIASVSAGSIPLTIILAQERAKELDLFPDRRLFLRYRIADVTWV